MFSGVRLSFAAPSITALLGDKLLPTTGFDALLSRAGVVVIVGSNFGPNSTALTVQYGDGASLQYYGTNCVRDGTQSMITCNGSPGVGQNLSWSVTVAGQHSGASTNTTSYPAPSLSSVTGVGASDADTQGGQQVTLTGVDFGPVIASPPWQMAVTYGVVRVCCACVVQCVVIWFDHCVMLLVFGQTGYEYTAASCVVTAASPTMSQATCLTAPGIGKGLQWRICVSAQCSALAGNTSYGRPIVSYFTGVGSGLANTEGNEVGMLPRDRGLSQMSMLLCDLKLLCCRS